MGNWEEFAFWKGFLVFLEILTHGGGGAKSSLSLKSKLFNAFSKFCLQWLKNQSRVSLVEVAAQDQNHCSESKQAQNLCIAA